MISIIHPSRGRPDKAFATYLNWLNKAGDKNIEYILSLDTIDCQYYRDKFEGCIMTVNSNNNVVDAMNAGAKKATGDILVCISDDFNCPVYWDTSILMNINPNKEEALHINDGIMKYECMSLPIMTKKLYDKLGYIYFPDYGTSPCMGMFADTDLLQVCKRMVVLKENFDLRFPHEHYINGKAAFDETYRRHNNKDSYVCGERLFKQREQNNFGV